MNTQIVYTFKTRLAVMAHLRALAQLATSVCGSNRPLLDYNVEFTYLMRQLLFCKKYTPHTLYIAIRTLGFECRGTKNLFMRRLAYYNDVIKSYTIRYNDGYYELCEFVTDESHI